MITYWHINNLFNELPKELLELTGWYISGSSATSYEYNDIDIYFESKEAFDAVYILFQSLPGYTLYDMKHFIEINPKPSGSNLFSDFSDEPTPSVSRKHTIQLVCKYFESPEEMLARFDINICRNAILPDRTYYQHPTSLDLMYIDNITASSASRFHKYIMRGFPIDTDKYIELVHYLCSNPDQKFDNFYNEGVARSRDLLRILLNIYPLLKLTTSIMLQYDNMLDIIRDNGPIREIIPNNLLPLEIFTPNSFINKHCHSSFRSQHPEFFI